MKRAQTLIVSDRQLKVNTSEAIAGEVLVLRKGKKSYHVVRVCGG